MRIKLGADEHTLGYVCEYHHEWPDICYRQGQACLAVTLQNGQTRSLVVRALGYLNDQRCRPVERELLADVFAVPLQWHRSVPPPRGTGHADAGKGQHTKQAPLRLGELAEE